MTAFELLHPRSCVSSTVGIAAALALAASLSGCAKRPVSSGVAVAKAGQGLAAHAGAVPKAATVCALEEALKAPPPPGGEKPVGAACNNAVASDELWRRALVVLAAHSTRLESIAAGEKPESTGQLEAALTGVTGPDFVEVGAEEQAARDAVLQLVNQMGAKSEKNDLAKAVQDAAPHVKTLCEGLDDYLGAQVKRVGEIQMELDKKRTTRTDRRCGTLDTRTVCVSESVLDRLVYADAFGELASIEGSHLETRNAVSGFCAAHRKLEDAAGSGTLKKAQTYGEVVAAIKAAPRAKSERDQGTAEAGEEGKPAESAKDAGAAKPAPAKAPEPPTAK